MPAPTIIDHRVIERLLVAALVTAGGASITVLASGEPYPDGQTGPVAQVTGMTIVHRGCPGGGSTSPDMADMDASVVLTINDADTRADIFDSSTAAALLCGGLFHLRSADTAHELHITAAESRLVAAPDDSGRVRVHQLTVRGTAYRHAGTTLE